MKLRAGFSIQQQQDLHHAEQKMTVMSIMDKQWLAFVQFTFRPLFQYRYPADLFMNTRMRISKLATYSVITNRSNLFVYQPDIFTAEEAKADLAPK